MTMTTFMASDVHRWGNQPCEWSSSHNCCIEWQKQPHKIYKHVQDSLDVNVWCGIMHGAKDNLGDEHLPGYVTTCHKMRALKKKKAKICVNKMELHHT